MVVQARPWRPGLGRCNEPADQAAQAPQSALICLLVGEETEPKAARDGVQRMREARMVLSSNGESRCVRPPLVTLRFDPERDAQVQ